VNTPRSTPKSERRRELATVLCLTAFYLYIASFVIGISFRDDSDYLRSGALVNHFSFLSMQQWTPLYAVWFSSWRYSVPTLYGDIFYPGGCW
jgi:hypothetical protein